MRRKIEDIANTTKNLTLLYIEDEKNSREQVAQLLNIFFQQIDIATNGQEGLDLYKAHHDNTNKYHDVIISDIMMPVLDGIEMSKQIYLINKNQRIIVTSAHDEKENLIKLLNLGIDGFLIKPVSMENIIQILNQLAQRFISRGQIALSEEISFNRQNSTLFQKNKKVHLTKNEILLLELFTDNQDIVLNIDTIYNHLYFNDPDKSFSIDSIRSLIKRLRQKIPAHLIRSSYNNGYIFSLKPQAS